MAERKKALVAGLSGVVGRRLAEYIHGLDDWDVVGLSRREPTGGSPVARLAVDLTDPIDTREKLGGLSDVTHIFYEARYDHPEGKAEPIETNLGMFRNLVDTMLPVAKNLQHVHVGSGHKNYGLHIGPVPTPAKESQPRTLLPSFYYQQEDYIRALQKGQSWGWSTARPTGLCDHAPGISRSIVMLICAYAAICKEMGLPLRFPGTPQNYTSHYQVTEAIQLAKGTVWMASEPQCANQDFNITNGDYFRWCDLWPKFAEYFGMEMGPVQTLDLQFAMSDKEPVWNRIVEKHGLKPTPFDKLVIWKYSEHVWKPTWDVMTDTTKARRFGFHELVDSEEMFFRLFDHFRAQKIVP